jgi:hypothetical protein
MKQRNYHSNLAFLDLLLNIVLAYAMFYILTSIYVNPKIPEEKNVIAKAEAVITFTWDTDIADDVDAYVEDPAGGIVYFQDKEENLMHLDRDDLGNANDTVIVNGHRFEYKENQEIVTIRGWMAGEYVVNVHMFSKRVQGPTEVTIMLEKLNPSWKLIAAKTVTLTVNGDEQTAFRFTVNKKGEVTDINYLPKKIVGSGGSGPRLADPYYDEGYDD